MLHKLAAGIFDDAPLESGPPELERVFAANGLLAAYNPNYVVRDSQLQLARATHRALTEKRHLMVEAPCGVGKSIGYAVPAILTRDSRKYMTTDAYGRPQARFAPVVIVTANIALQEQLTKKDLPFLKEALGVPFDFKLLKGRQNYLCRTMYEYGNATQERDTGSEREMLARLEAWAATTTTGDRNELDFEPPPALWRRFSMSNDECPGKLCPLFNECHGFNAQIAAQNADIIVTNYHTLFIDIHLRLTAGIGILNELSPVILDEAHEAPDIARDVMGGNVTTGLLLAAFSACHKAKLCGRGQHDAEVFAFFAALDAHSRAEYKHRLLHKSFTNAAKLRHTLHKLAEAAEQTLEFSANSLSATERSTLYTAQKRVLNVSRLLQIVDELPEAYVVSLDRSDAGNSTYGLTASIKVVEPSRMLERTLYKRPSVVCTSATLTAQGSFELISSELGAPRDLTDYADLPTPFNFEQQAMLIVPANIPPDPNSDEFRTAMGQALCETVNYARGRTLGLFTSYRNLRIAGDALRAAGCPYRILQQGDAPRTTLTKEFRDDVQSVLLGTASFWTGVDVPGEALSCLFIDKLPFPAFGDPVLEALGDKYDDAFTRFSLPRTVMTLRQGIGRLIRANTDRGVMVILDQRLWTKNYGHSFIQSMPKMCASTNLADIRTFLNGNVPEVPWGMTRRERPTNNDDALPF